MDGKATELLKKLSTKRSLILPLLTLAVIVPGLVVNPFVNDLSFKNTSVEDYYPTTGYKPWELYIGDIVSSTTGNLHWTDTDASLQVLGFGLVLNRYYNTHAMDNDGLFGSGWMTLFESKVLSETGVDGLVYLVDSDGSYINFTYQSQSKYLPSAGYSYYRLYNNSDGYKLIHKDGWSQNYDTAGRLLNITNDEGHALTLEYENGLFTKVIDDSGRYLSFTTENDLVKTITDHTSRVWRYYYDDSKLVRVVNPAGEDKVYKYDEAGRLSEAIAEDHRAYLFHYDTKHRVTNVFFQKVNSTRKTALSAYDLFAIHYFQGSTGFKDSLQAKSTVYYDDVGRTTKITNPLGENISRSWTSDNQVETVTNDDGDSYTFTYDSFGNIIQVTDPTNNKTSYTYDTTDVGGDYRSVVSSHVDYNGYTTNYFYQANSRLISKLTNPLNDNITYTYDSYGNLITMTDECGATQHYIYDNYGQMTNLTTPEGLQFLYTYDLLGRVTQVTEEDVGRSGQKKTHTYTYDVMGNVLTMTDPEGFVTTFYYDEVGRVIATKDPLGRWTNESYNELGEVEASTDASGNSTYTRFNRNGQPYLVVKEDGSRTQVMYDPIGRVVEETNADGTTKTYTYDNVGRLVEESLEDGTEFTYTYDSLGRRVQTDVNLLNGSTFLLERLWYDANGNVVKRQDSLNSVTLFYYDGRGLLVDQTSPANINTTFVYDPCGRLIQEIDQDGGQTHYVYDQDGRLISLQNPVGALTQYDYDGSNVVQVTDPMGNITLMSYYKNDYLKSVTDALGYSETFVYDGLGQLLSLTDKAGYEWNYKYDSLGRVVETSDPLGYKESFRYDARGNLLSSIDKEGFETTYEYDMMGRVTKVTDALGGVVSYEYDSRGRVSVETNRKGNSTYYGYDELGNLVNKTNCLGMSELWIYDFEGNLVEHVDLKGARTKYFYDPLGWLASVVDPNGGMSHYQYSPGGKLLQYQNKLGAITRHTYDPAGQILTRIDASGNTTEYTHDLMGNIIAVKDARNKTTTYQYDALGQLTNVTDALGEVTSAYYGSLGHLTKTVDPLGNWVAYEYDAVGNRVKEYSNLHSVEYTYNGLGGLVNETTYGPTTDPATWLYTYDGLSRLVTETNPLGIVAWQYGYDLNNNVVSRTNANGHTWLYEYDFLDNLVAIIEPTGNTTHYTHTPTGKIDMRITPEGEQIHYLYDLNDNLVRIEYPQGESVDIFLDAEGNVVRVENHQQLHETIYYEYDALNRVVNHTTSIPSPAYTTQVLYQYDEVGNRISRTDPFGTVLFFYDDNNRLDTFVNYDLSPITYVWDAAGRLVEKDFFGNSTTFYEYDQLHRVINQTTVNRTDDIVHQLWYSYDARGNVLEEVSYAKGTYGSSYFGNYTEENATTNFTSRYSYDLASQVLSYLIINQTWTRLTQYDYDDAGNMVHEWGNASTQIFFISSFDPSEEIVTIDHKWFYNNDERPYKRLDNDCNETWYVYDTRGNRVFEFWNGTPLINMTYDWEDRMVQFIANRTGVTLDKYWSAKVDGVQNRLLKEHKLTAWSSHTYAYFNYDLSYELGWWLHYNGPESWSATAEGPSFAKYYFDVGQAADNNLVTESTHWQLNTNDEWQSYYYSTSSADHEPLKTLVLYSGLDRIQDNKNSGSDAPSNDSPGKGYPTPDVTRIPGYPPGNTIVVEDPMNTGRASVSSQTGNLGTSTDVSPTGASTKLWYHTPETDTYLSGYTNRVAGGYSDDVFGSDIAEHGDYEGPLSETGSRSYPSQITKGDEERDPLTPKNPRNNPKNHPKKAEVKLNIAGVFAGIIDDLLDDFIDTFVGEALGALAAKLLSSILGKAGKGVQKHIRGFVDKVLDAGGIKDFVSNAIKNSGLMNSIKDKLKDVAKDVMNKAIPQWLKDKLNEMLAKCLPLDKARDWLKDKLKDFLGDKMNALAEKAANLLVNNPFVSRLIDQLGARIGRTIMKKVLLMAARIGLKFVPVIGWILGALDLAATIWEFLPDSWKDGIKNWLSDRWNDIKSGFRNAFKGLSGLGRMFLDAGKKVVTKVTNTIKRAWNWLWSW